jgi:hypothetical protein
VQGFQAAKEGQRPQAYDLFCEVVRLDPSNEHGWLYRAATTDDMAEAYVCLQRVLSINPNNQKAQRGVERIRTKMAGEEGPEEAATPTPNNTTEAKAEVTPIHEPDYNEDSEMEAAEDSGYNPPATDFAVVSGLDSAGADFLQYSKQGSEQSEANSGFSSNYAQASGYPYPTEEEPAANFNFANAAPSFSSNDVYTPVDINNYEPVSPQMQPQYEQNRFYQPQPLEENQNRFYQPQATEEYRSPQAGNYDNSAMSFANTARDYQPANYQAPNNPIPSYQSNPVQPDQLPDFLTLRDEGQAAGPNGAGGPKNKRNNFKVAKVSTPKAPKPKGSGFSLKNLGRREEAPLIATFGSEGATDLDEVGLARSKNVQRRAIFIFIGLAIIVFLLVGVIFVLRGRGGEVQQAANPTDIVPPPSTTSVEGNPTDSSGTPGANMTTTSGSDTGTATVNPTTTDPNGTNSNATTTVVNVATTSAAPTTQATTTVAPAVTTTAPPAVTTTAPASNSTLKPIVYTIASGDNLTKVSQKFGTTIDAIIAANRPTVISPSRIFAGQKMIIPVSRPTFTGKGGIITGPNDTIASVAAKYNVKPEDLLKFNGLTDANEFKPGDALLIP